MSRTTRTIVPWGVGSEGTVGSEIARTSIGSAWKPDAAGKLAERAKRYLDLTALAASLFDECRRLRVENDDLRASAAIWIRLYEQQLGRVKALEQQLPPTSDR